MNNYLLILISTIFTITPVICINQYISTNDFYWPILALISVAISLFAFYKILLSGYNTVVIFAIIRALSMIFMTLSGIFILKEKLKIKTFIGILLIMISIILLSSDSKG